MDGETPVLQQRPMKGLTLEALRGVVTTGRAVGKLQVQADGGRWIVVFLPPGGTRSGWVQHGFFLKAEKSGKPRRFARADTALRVVAGLRVVQGVWVSLRGSSIGGFQRDDSLEVDSNDEAARE